MTINNQPYLTEAGPAPKSVLLKQESSNLVLRNRWIEALWNEEYEQGYSNFRSLDDKFCVLGVLCDLYDSDQWVEQEHRYTWKTYASFMPREISNSVGMHLDGWTRLIICNDSKKMKFKEMVEHMKRYPATYFNEPHYTSWSLRAQGT